MVEIGENLVCTSGGFEKGYETQIRSFLNIVEFDHIWMVITHFCINVIMTLQLQYNLVRFNITQKFVHFRGVIQIV